MRKTSRVGRWLVGVLAWPVLAASACLVDVPHAPDYLAEDADCGNGIVDLGEECDREAVGSTCIDEGYASGNLTCQIDCTHDVSSCRSHPEAGQVVITEIMKQPIPDEAGLEAEWFEIFNPTAEAVELGECWIEGSPGEPGFPVDSSNFGVLLGPMEHRIFHTDATASLVPVGIRSWPSSDFGLSNDGIDVVRLTCDGLVVDEVTYDDSTFPDSIGRSMTLDAGAYDAGANDDGARWCACMGSNDDEHRYGYEEPYAFGTPNAPNPACPPGSAASGAVLYLSEYADGDALADDALEIYNGSEGPLGIATCEIRIHYDGATEAGSIIPLAGSIPSRSVTVLCNAGFFFPEACDLLSDEVVFSGRETLVLACDGSTLDVFGQVGFDPGVEWDVDGVGTRRATLRRSCETDIGDVDETDPFDPSLEWIEFAVDDFSDLERYYCT